MDHFVGIDGFVGLGISNLSYHGRLYSFSFVIGCGAWNLSDYSRAEDDQTVNAKVNKVTKIPLMNRRSYL